MQNNKTKTEAGAGIDLGRSNSGCDQLPFPLSTFRRPVQAKQTAGIPLRWCRQIWYLAWVLLSKLVDAFDTDHKFAFLQIKHYSALSSLSFNWPEVVSNCCCFLFFVFDVKLSTACLHSSFAVTCPLVHWEGDSPENKIMRQLSFEVTLTDVYEKCSY